MGIVNNKLYIGYTDRNLTYGIPSLLISDLDTGNVTFKELNINGSGTGVSKLYADDSGIYIIPGKKINNGILLIKLDKDLNVKYVKALYPDSGFVYVYDMFSDSNYLYLVLNTSSSYYLVKVRKTDGEKISDRRIFRKDRFVLSRGATFDDYLYFGSSYPFWGSEDIFFKSSKYGKLLWANKLDLCQKVQCVDPIIRIFPYGKDYLEIWGYFSDDEEGSAIKGPHFYNVIVSSQDGLSSNCTNYISKLDNPESKIGFSSEYILADYQDLTDNVEVDLKNYNLPPSFNASLIMEDGSELVKKVKDCSSE